MKQSQHQGTDNGQARHRVSKAQTKDKNPKYKIKNKNRTAMQITHGLVRSDTK